MTWARDDGRARARVCLKVVVVVAVAWGRRRRWDILLSCAGRRVFVCVWLSASRLFVVEDRRLSRSLFLFGGWSLNGAGKLQGKGGSAGIGYDPDLCVCVCI